MDGSEADIGGSHLSDAFTADHVAASVNRRRFPLALAVRVSEAAVALRRTGRPVPAVDTDVRRLVAEIVSQTAVAVRRTRLSETHRVWQTLPRVPTACTHRTFTEHRLKYILTPSLRMFGLITKLQFCNQIL